MESKILQSYCHKLWECDSFVLLDKREHKRRMIKAPRSHTHLIIINNTRVTNHLQHSHANLQCRPPVGVEQICLLKEFAQRCVPLSEVYPVNTMGIGSILRYRIKQAKNWKKKHNQCQQWLKSNMLCNSTSSNAAPIIWRPTGRLEDPSRTNPQGNTKAGSPAKLTLTCIEHKTNRGGNQKSTFRLGHIWTTKLWVINYNFKTA